MVDREPTMNRLLEAALAYGEIGMVVFPGHSLTAARQCTCARKKCGSPGKHPRIKEWQRKASKDPQVVREWWDRWPTANVCIATGAISGVIVLDVDPRHGGTESRAALEAEHGALPKTWTSRTGGGGFHFFFRHPGHEVTNKTNLLPGIDIRGDGGFVVAPPSVHLSGKEYSWT